VALQRVKIPSPNYSSRGGAKVRLIVLHTAEGARTYQDLGAFFANPASGVSSQVGIDDTPGVIGEYVPRSGKAWTQGNANGVAVSVELCAFAAWTPQEWANHEAMLDNCAQWVAEEAAYFGIPITRLTPSQAQGSGIGVCQHIDLGSWGGGHVDCDYGTGNFPMDQVLVTARQYAAGGKPEPTPPTTSFWEEDMIIVEPNGDEYQLIYGGDKSYWRTLPANAANRIPDSMKIKDDGSLKSLWKVGSK
jgi:hypothetical protein